MLREVPYTPSANGLKFFVDDLTGEFIKICIAIHTYSFDIFCVQYRAVKGASKLSAIRRVTLLGQATFHVADVPLACGNDYKSHHLCAGHETI